MLKRRRKFLGKDPPRAATPIRSYHRERVNFSKIFHRLSTSFLRKTVASAGPKYGRQEPRDRFGRSQSRGHDAKTLNDWFDARTKIDSFLDIKKKTVQRRVL